jgi:hypothetical protein
MQILVYTPLATKIFNHSFSWAYYLLRSFLQYGIFFIFNIQLGFLPYDLIICCATSLVFYYKIFEFYEELFNAYKSNHLLRSKIVINSQFIFSSRSKIAGNKFYH